MMDALKTFNIIVKNHNSSEDIEKEFEATRNEYLRDLAKIRRKYESKLLKLVSEYKASCL